MAPRKVLDMAGGMNRSGDNIGRRLGERSGHDVVVPPWEQPSSAGGVMPTRQHHVHVLVDHR